MLRTRRRSVRSEGNLWPAYSSLARSFATESIFRFFFPLTTAAADAEDGVTAGVGNLFVMVGYSEAEKNDSKFNWMLFALAFALESLRAASCSVGAPYLAALPVSLLSLYCIY